MTVLSHLIGVACVEAGNNFTNCWRSLRLVHYYSKYCRGTRGWTFFLPNQSKSRKWEKGNANLLKWECKAVVCMSEHFISQGSTESAAGLWPDQTPHRCCMAFCSTYCYLLFCGLCGPCCAWTASGTASRSVRRTRLQIFIQSNTLQRRGVDRQMMGNAECRMRMRRIVLASTRNEGGGG